MRNEKVQKLVMTGVFAALSYVVFTFLQIKITLPGGYHIHPPGKRGLRSGRSDTGRTLWRSRRRARHVIGDIFDPIYVIYAPKTFILKLLHRTDYRANRPQMR